MDYIQQAFSGPGDLAHFTHLVHQHPGEHLHVVDLPYRLASWAFDDPANAALWLDARGKPAAWAVLQTPFWTLDIACRPEAVDVLYPQVLAWAVARGEAIIDTPSGHPCWYVNILPRQVGQIAALEQAGFACQADVGEDSWSQVWLARPAQAPLPETHLPSGFQIRPLTGFDEVQAYVDLHQAVFETKNMTVEWRRQTLLRPEYIPALDLLAIDASGAPAGFCIGWFDPQGFNGRPCGQIEPMGMRDDLRGVGLGKALLCEVLRRLHLQGAETVYVQTDDYRGPALTLYEAAGFQRQGAVLVYCRDFA